MRLTKLFSLIQSRFAWRKNLDRWTSSRRVSWPVSAATESLEDRCLLAAGSLDSNSDTAWVDEYGDSQRQELARQLTQNLARAQADAIHRGLGNSSVMDSSQRTVYLDYNQRLLQLEDALMRQKLDIGANSTTWGLTTDFGAWVDQYANTQRQQLTQRRDQQITEAKQSATRRGMRSSSYLDSLDRGIKADYDQLLLQFEDDLLLLKSDYGTLLNRAVDESGNGNDVAADAGEVVVSLPSKGGTFNALFLDGYAHLRSPKGTEMISPVVVPNGAWVQFDGSNFNDRLTLDESWVFFTGSLWFDGNGGNDKFDARAVNLDVWFNGGDGNDTFLGGSGNDTVDGGAGNDSLCGGDGDDLLGGGDGNDKLKGDAGDDVLDGGDGNDNLQGLNGDDSIRGGNGNDKLNGGIGDDVLSGSSGNDLLQGGLGIDWLLGDGGNDVLKGGAGTDFINPGSPDIGTDKVSDKSRVIDTTSTFDFDALIAGLLSHGQRA